MYLSSGKWLWKPIRGLIAIFQPPFTAMAVQDFVANKIVSPNDTKQSIFLNLLAPRHPGDRVLPGFASLRSWRTAEAPSRPLVRKKPRGSIPREVKDSLRRAAWSLPIFRAPKTSLVQTGSPHAARP